MTDAEFLAAFESGALAPFHHRDHPRMAWLYLQRDGAAAEASVLAGLRHFADVKGRNRPVSRDADSLLGAAGAPRGGSGPCCCLR